MNLQQFRIFLYRYINQKSTAEEERVFDDFFDAYQDETVTEHTAEEREAIRNNIFSKLEARVFKRQRRTISLPAVAKLAAAVLLLVSAGLLVFRSHTRHADLVAITAKGTHKEVKLADGSVVLLNADSKLIYPAGFDGKTREVTLSGEAFFKVAKNPEKPFIVHTASLQTTVLGTSFNVAAYKDDPATVTVVTGRVRVAAGDNSDVVVLHPDQQTTLLPGKKLFVQTVHATDYTAWDEGVIYLKETPLKQMAGMLERKYNIHIQLAGPAAQSRCLFNGRLADDRIANVLENLHFMSNLQYTMVNDSLVVINSVSCE